MSKHVRVVFNITTLVLFKMHRDASATLIK